MANTIASGYGSDLSTFANVASGIADLDPTFAVISGPLVVIQRIARKLMTPTGMMLKPGWGFDLRTLLQGSLTPSQIGAVRGIVSEQVSQEPEVDSVTVTISYTLQLKTLTIVIMTTLKGSEQSFPLVFTLSPDKVSAIINDMVLMG